MYFFAVKYLSRQRISTEYSYFISLTVDIKNEDTWRQITLAPMLHLVTNNMLSVAWDLETTQMWMWSVPIHINHKTIILIGRQTIHHTTSPRRRLYVTLVTEVWNYHTGNTVEGLKLLTIGNWSARLLKNKSLLVYLAATMYCFNIWQANCSRTISIYLTIANY